MSAKKTKELEDIKEQIIKETGIRVIKSSRISYNPDKNKSKNKDYIAKGGFGAIYHCRIKGEKKERGPFVVKVIAFNNDLLSIKPILNEIALHRVCSANKYVIELISVAIRFNDVDTSVLDINPDTGTEDKKLDYLVQMVMPFCQTSLEQYCMDNYSRGDELSFRLDLIFYQVLLGLEYIHKKGIIH